MSFHGRATIVALALPVLLTGCAPEGLSFRVDERVSIVSPKDRAEVSLPISLEWTVRDFDLKTSPSDTGGSFAVFVDRSPVPPGETLSSLARGDETCEITPRCPDAAYFAERGVYETTDTKLTITKLPGSSTAPSDRRDRHRAVIVLLDESGKRIGEIAFDVTFDLKRKG